MKPCLERIDKHWGAIYQYFIKTLPARAQDPSDKNAQKNAKDAIKTVYYKMVKETLTKRDCQFWVKVIIFICERFYGFLTKMQSAGPQIADLYKDCCDLLFGVISCLVVEGSLPDKTDTRKLSKFDLSKHNRNIPKMSVSAKDKYSSLSAVSQDNDKRALRKVYKEIGEYLQNNLKPLDSKLVKNLRVLEPKNCAGLFDGG